MFAVWKGSLKPDTLNRLTGHSLCITRLGGGGPTISNLLDFKFKIVV